MTDDKALVSQVLNGDRQSFRLLIRQHERLVTHMISRLIDRKEDREELCQDTFLKVFEKLSEFNFQSRLSTWIATIAYRNAVNHLRKKKINVTDIQDEGPFTKHLMSTHDPYRDLEDRDLNERVLQLIEQLPIPYKTVLTLYHLDSMNYFEIGEITGMPEGTVKNYLFRARNLLKEKVKRYLSQEEVL
jgi:RNA polymerase sigma factor (sigma-70 family)